MIDKIELYRKAKLSYYKGNPIMSDTEFDALEIIVSALPEFKKYVGFGDDDRNAKFNHVTKMLSLSKIQAGIDGTLSGIIPTDDFSSWLKSKNILSQTKKLEATPKFDGNAINLIYKGNSLDAILSRGDGTAGRDYTNKLNHIVPNSIDIDGYDFIEVRGEVVIDREIFNKSHRYSDGKDYKNERNYVAGVLNRDEDMSHLIKDFAFLAVEIKGTKDGKTEHISIQGDTLKNLGFNLEHSLFKIIFGTYDFAAVYEEMLDYRINKCPYLLDGFVIKTPESTRAYFGESSHDPNWALAVKFPAEETITSIEGIEWNMGKDGQLTPVALLKPIELDGTTVRRASMHNYGWIIENKCMPGAIVKIAKKGDIIPQITEVVSYNFE